MDFEQYKPVIRPLLSDKRYQHSLCVAKEAIWLAEKYGGDPQKAGVAGILHDIMKDLPPEQQLKKLEEYHISLSQVERSAQKLWHAMLGAAYLQRELAFADKEILDAVRYHTTGRENMTQLDKILFVADFTSKDRDYDGVDEIRRAADQSLEEAMMQGMVFTICELAQARRPVHPDTLAAFNQAALSLNNKGQ